MPGVVNSMTELIGKTPMLRLKRLGAGLPADVIVKIEAFNPGGSVKDRIGFSMIRDAKDKGLLKRDTVIIEPTSGNTGIALAFVCAAMGYRLILTMPNTISQEHYNLLKAYGAELVLTPSNRGMKGAMLKADELVAKISNSISLRQFKNSANVKVHQLTTAEEIWTGTGGRVDILVGGVGTGGTITGVGEIMKKRKPGFKVVAVEPFDSPVLAGGRPGQHEIPGIGTGFVPELLDLSVIDEVFPVKSEEALEVGRRLAREEGVLAGVSSGAAVSAALRLASRPENHGRMIVAVLPDTGERYLNTALYNEVVGQSGIHGCFENGKKRRS